MSVKTEKTFTISLPNPHSSECGSSREQKSRGVHAPLN